MTSVVSALVCSSTLAVAQTSVTPLGPVVYLDGTTRGEPFGDNQATATYFGPNRPIGAPNFLKAWLGSVGPGVQDIQVPLLNEVAATDRVLVAESEDGHFFNSIRAAIKGRGGDTTTTGPASLEVHDDYTCGSPSMVYNAGKLLMFYECIGNSMWPLHSVWSPSRLDTHTAFLDASGRMLANDDASYSSVGSLGFALQSPRRGTKAIYAGEATYGFKKNRFLSTQPIGTTVPGGTSQALNGGKPAFHVYTTPASGRKMLYSCFDSAQVNTFATTDQNCLGRGSDAVVEMLGYLSTENSPDLDGASMNSIFMATSDDFGKTWQRFEGPQLDGAVIEPYNPRANIDCPGRNAFAITHSNGSASYGAGFPTATIRDGFLEIHYADSTLIDNIFQPCGPPDANGNPTNGTYIYSARIPLAQALKPAAWSTPQVQRHDGGIGTDLAWDPITRRYYVNVPSPVAGSGPLCSSSFRHETKIVKSQPVAEGTFPKLTFIGPDAEVLVANSTPGRQAITGGFARTPEGHVIRDNNYMDFHLYVASRPEAHTISCDPANFASVFDDFDTDHILGEVSTTYQYGQWRDRDDSSGTGDYEVNFGDLNCSTPVHMQARVRGGVTLINHIDEAPDALRSFSTSGLACVNSDQADGRCSDYEVRFACAL